MNRGKPFIDWAPPVICKAHDREECEECMRDDIANEAALIATELSEHWEEMNLRELTEFIGAKLKSWEAGLGVVKTISKINLEPGDVLFFHHPMRLSDVAMKHIRSSVKDVLPGAQVFVLEEGMDVSALSAPKLREILEKPQGGYQPIVGKVEPLPPPKEE